MSLVVLRAFGSCSRSGRECSPPKNKNKKRCGSCTGARKGKGGGLAGGVGGQGVLIQSGPRRGGSEDDVFLALCPFLPGGRREKTQRSMCRVQQVAEQLLVSKGLASAALSPHLLRKGCQIQPRPLPPSSFSLSSRGADQPGPPTPTPPLWPCSAVNRAVPPAGRSGWTSGAAPLSPYSLRHDPASQEEAEAAQEHPKNDGDDLAWRGRKQR